ARAVMTEPLACVLHAAELAVRANTRYRLTADTSAPDRVRTIAVLGAGPAGLLFVQVLRHHYAFDGPIVVSDPSAHKRALATSFGATAVPPDELQDTVLQASGGRRAELLVEASGSGHVIPAAADVIRKQATVLLYGVGHGDAPLEHLTLLQWKEAVLVTSVGASGGFDADGRPTIYRAALRLLERGRIDVGTMQTHRYERLTGVPMAFTGAHREPDYVKAVAELT
ncbi:MAG TPA: hypothetical protein ENI87_06950, partial [bacterium]|nr:hypothetical protein [bacterium]